MHQLETLLLKNIAEKLQRKTITRCSQWAESYRVMGNPFPGPWTFVHHPWLLEMHDAECTKVVGQKAAQMGFTEWAMNSAFYFMDSLGLDVLYVLPTSDDASDFSAGRFDPALELSPHLRNYFADVNNVGLKRAGSNILYVRGSHSRSKLKSIPTPVIIFDEVEEMPKASLVLAQERQSGQLVQKTLMLSTPSIEDAGINAEYKTSTEEHFFFKCPKCSRLTELIYPDCLVITGESIVDPNLSKSHLICKECKGVLPHESKTEWLKHRDRGGTSHFVPAHSDRDVRGFHVPQMYSMVPSGSPHKLAIAALQANGDPTYAQEFYNSKLGIPFEAQGARVSDQQIQACIRDYYSGPYKQSNTIVTMGIDVGAVLHIVVKEFIFRGHRLPGLSINDVSDAKILLATTSSGKSTDFDEAFEIFRDYGVWGCVVDAEPERRAALQFAQKLWGRVLLCDYLWSQQGREATVNEDEASLKCNRTSWMDLSLGRYKNGTIILPRDIPTEFRRHIREPVRVFKEDKWGNKYGVYVNANADHFAHADTYAELALPLACSVAENQDITENYHG